MGIKNIDRDVRNFIAFYNAGTSASDILGRTGINLYEYLKENDALSLMNDSGKRAMVELGIKSKRGRQKVELPLEEILYKKRCGMTYEQLGEKYGFSATKIQNDLNEYVEENGLYLTKFEDIKPEELWYELKRNRVPDRELSRKTGLTVAKIHYLINEMHEKKTEAERVRVAQPIYKIDDALLDGIIRKKVTPAEVMRRSGITKEQLLHLVNVRVAELNKEKAERAEKTFIIIR